MKNWTLRTLNIPRGIILLKSLLQSIPIYRLTSQATPKIVCLKMVDMFKKFLWQGPNTKKKWALLSWSWLGRFIKGGGLGLHVPYILNQVVGAKLWWRRIQGGVDLWKTLWERKSDMPRSLEGQLRSQNDKKGSAI